MCSEKDNWINRKKKAFKKAIFVFISIVFPVGILIGTDPFDIILYLGGLIYGFYLSINMDKKEIKRSMQEEINILLGEN